MTFNTGNPIGSTDARDRLDNSENLDIAVNSLSQTFVDRLGVTRDTLEGVYQKSAYYRAGTFDAGYTLTNNRQTLAYGNIEYSWSGAFPKVVSAGSTPATSGGIGAGAWVDRTDVTLRSELISNNQIPVTVSQFGGNSGFANDSTVALIAFINAINSGAHEGSEFLIDGLYRTTQPLPAITKPVSMSGVTTANSAILFDNVNDGLSLDLSGTPSNTVQSTFSNFSILTNKTLAGTGFWYIPNSGSSQSVKLELNSMRVDSLDRFNNSSSTKEWLVGVRLGVDGGSFKPSEVRIDNLVLYGSDANGGYAGLTSAGSSGIVADGATNCIITRSKIFLLSGYGVLFRGQSEGTNIISSQVVAVRNGVGYTGVVNPSNNHSISNTHISPYERGIYIKAPTTDAGVSTPLANYFTNIFILERGDTADKNARFIGVDVAARFSKFANVTVWANAKAGGVHEKIGFRVANGGNILHNCHSHRMTYSMETFDAIAGFAHDVAVHDFHDEDSIIGLLSPASTKQVSGMVRSDSLAGRTWRRPVHFMNQFTAKHENGTEYFDVNGGVVTIKSPSGDTTNFRHVPNTSTDNTPGATIIGVGGTTVDNQGNWILRAALTQFSGSQSPEVANKGTVGTPGLPFAGGFTQSAFTVTSDENHKTKPLMITDAMLDAAAEVDWVQYQYLDRVEEKGGDGARWHFGAIAQRYIEAFERHGLDPYRFAFICYDEWGDSPELIGEDGEVISPAVEAGSRYGIRYDQAIILKQKQIERDHKRQLDALVARIEALESN